MDDLYNNAWGDSSDYASTSSTAWKSPVVPSSAQHEDADLANPSWSTGSDIKWDEPSHHASGFAWSTAEPDLAWGSNKYEDIPLGKPEIESTDEDPPIPTVKVDDVESPKSPEESHTPETVVTDDAAPAGLGFSPPIDVEQESPTASPDPDGFGTFEDATTAEDKEYATKLTSDVEDDAWGSPWASAPVEDEEDDATPVDEWEVARQHKEQLDRKVPPELLASIISQCEEYYRDAANSDESGKSQSREEPWMSDWRSGIEGIEGFEALMQTLVPELTLQPTVQFTKTSIAKNMAGCVRLTKNLPLSKASPMSHYLAAKGSTAWEAAVKQRKEISEEDVVPVGWRIIEKQNTGASENESPSNSRTSGGFFSFWSKRQSKTPVPSTASPKESSPTRSSISSQPSALSGGVDNSSARPSVETLRTPSLSNDRDRLPSPAPDAVSRKASLDILASTSPVPPTTYTDAPEPQVDPQAQPAQPPTSAVSRFLNRFSHKRSSLGSASPRSSLALSTDDLEFLSDIVPSASDNHDDDDSRFKNLNDILKPEPLPPVLPPPPLAPPPRPASAATTVSQRASTALTGSKSLLGSSDILPSPSQSQTPQSDLDDVFGAFEVSPSSTSAPGTASVPTASVPAAGSSGRVPTRSQSPLILAPQSRTTSPLPLSFSNTFVPTRAESQPSILLPPPFATPAAPQRSETNTSESTMPRRPSLKPKIPLSFTLPPPPADISPSLPSASEIPLAQLYPQAAARQQTQHASVGSSSRRPSIPVQPSRSLTPAVVQASLNPTTVSAPLLPPPPGSSRPAIVTAANLLGDDDDDFADFQSFAHSTDRASSAFSLPPPPSATTKHTALAPLLPPSSFTSSIHASPSTPQPLSSESLHDDFAAMLSSSASLDSHRTRTSGLNGIFQSDQSLLATPQKNKPFDFDNVSPVSSALRTPSPPRPISKSAKPLTPNPPSIPAPLSVLSPEEKQARASQHMRTLSLIERAAARPGQWPAPPSPLPQAISFGVLGAPPKNAVDLMGDDESFGAFASEGIKSLPSGPSPPKLDAIAGSAAGTKSQPLWGGLVAPSAPASAQLSAYQKSAGGLSAQDLSFFEGL